MHEEIMSREIIIKDIKTLVEYLPYKYTYLDYDDHCYRRMAYDCVCEKKWDLIVKAPFIEHASTQALSTCRVLLKEAVSDVGIIHEMNAKSRFYRKNDI